MLHSSGRLASFLFLWSLQDLTAREKAQKENQTSTDLWQNTQPSLHCSACRGFSTPVHSGSRLCSMQWQSPTGQYLLSQELREVQDEFISDHF